MSGLVRSSIHELPDQPKDEASHLLPTSISGKPLLPQHYTDSNQSRKRKRGPSGGVYEPSTILPCPHSHLDKPITSTPLFLLPRSRLNLSFIDTSPQSSPSLRTKFFSAYIPLLENPPIPKSANDQASVLIARLHEDNDALYAIEQVNKKTYVLCRLAAWVSEERLKNLAKWSPGIRLPTATSCVTASESGAWWKGASVIGSAQGRPAPPKRSKADVHRQPSFVSLEESQDVHQREAVINVAAPKDATPTTANAVVQQDQAKASDSTPQEIYFSLIQQYLETLYMSGASLAYFAKGPLSRARAACAAKQCTEGLVACLRDLVMTVSASEKKYKEALPTALKAHTGLDTGSERDKKRTRRKAKAPKRGKDGFLPCENDALEKWWASDDSTVSLNGDFEHAVRSRLPLLRSRETLLQVVLILEALALEKQISDNAKSETTREGVPNATTEFQITNFVDHTETQPRTKGKKPKDLPSLAETLVDRLTIWQSIETTDDKARGQAGQDAPQALAENTDKVKDFCLHTVIPFYGSRLPELVEKLSEKMGVALASPMRPKPKLKDPFARLAPGTAIARDRPAPDRRKPMSRVSSDSSGKQPRPPPALVRSATESSLQEIKRERSTTPRTPFLDSCPPSRPLSRSGSIADGTTGKDKKRRSLSRANSISQPNRSLSQREVDFSAITKYNEAKARKRVNVENELKDAIATLKKPNREAAVKPVIEEAQARQTQTKSKSSMLAQRRTQLGIEVNATPKRTHKHRDLVTATPHRQHHVLEPESVPSSNPCIPASTFRAASSGPSLIPASSPMAAQTPTRPFKKSSASTAYPGLPPAFRSPAVFSTPQKPAGVTIAEAVPMSSPPEPDVPATPAASDSIAVPASEGRPLYPSKTKENRIMAPPLLHRTTKPAAQAESQPTAETSIYDALGWDDDVDELM